MKWKACLWSTSSLIFCLLFFLFCRSLTFVQLDIDLCPLSPSHVLFTRLDRGVPFPAPAWRPSWLVALRLGSWLHTATACLAQLWFFFSHLLKHTHTHTHSRWDVSQIHISAGKKFKSSFNVPNSHMWLAHTPHEQGVENKKVFFDALHLKNFLLARFLSQIRWAWSNELSRLLVKL